MLHIRNMTQFVNNNVSPGDIVQANDHNTQGARVANVINGNIDNDNIKSSAGIEGSKLANDSITTSKVVDHAITSDKLDFTTLAFGNYSTSEVDTGFKWIDGRPIYRKTISLGAMPNATSKAVPHGITGLDIIIDMNGFISDNAPTYYPLPIPAGSSGTNTFLRISITSANFNMSASTNWSGYSGYVTLFYVKT